MSPRILEVENLHLFRGERHVLRGVQFSLGGGEYLEVRGANGAGKTSLLRTLCGLIWPEEGRVLWERVDVRRDLRTFHAMLAYLGHEPPLKADLSARENLRYWIGVRRRVGAAELDAALERVGGGSWCERLVRTLSAGQRRRVALAGLALLAVPLWLLDEPATHLDAAGQQLVSDLIGEQLARGGLVVAAVHQSLPAPVPLLHTLELPA
ncbi:MAG TPA: cytochrome c biogenesis heme-transporting ATPase CcmA [Steroidobacteraceae bacterium]|jgi:heme exporter protein A|nr:cytochrome c biogenesis heme-transporting ATPase CcmA [Steroidobacteraceae bacterium]